jgi:nucleotide-binding universal stress UspA family protein
MTLILVPLDGSGLAEEALPHVEELAGQLHADVHFLQVLDERPVHRSTTEWAPLGWALTTLDEEWENEKRSAEEYLSGLTTTWRAKGIYARWSVLEGKPASGILETAQRRGGEHHRHVHPRTLDPGPDCFSRRSRRSAEEVRNPRPYDQGRPEEAGGRP